MKLIQNRYAGILSFVLLLQAGAYYAVASKPDVIPDVRPLANFPVLLDSWRMDRDFPIEKEQLDVLKADDTLNREYVNASQTEQALLFIAFFKTQRYGQAPHSPKNCLPGSGWEPTLEGTMPVTVPGRTEPIVVNRYVVSKGDERSAVLYWYQGHNRVVASEYLAKFWLVSDSIRYRRSDTALVRIVIPVTDAGINAAVKTGADFVAAIFPDVTRQVP
jgi:EpsI family protein